MCHLAPVLQQDVVQLLLLPPPLVDLPPLLLQQRGLLKLQLPRHLLRDPGHTYIWVRAEMGTLALRALVRMCILCAPHCYTQ